MMRKIDDIHTMSDADLIHAYQRERIDITILYQRYADLVYGSCLKYFKNKADADDAVSEIFVLVSKKLKTHEVASFKSWLYTVTKNYCIEVLRRNNRLRDKMSAAESVYSEAIFHPDDAVDREVIRKMNGCIDNLANNQKQTIQLFYFDKVPYKNIADKLDLSWDQVRSLIQNGRRNIKNCLEKKGLGELQ